MVPLFIHDWRDMRMCTRFTPQWSRGAPRSWNSNASFVLASTVDDGNPGLQTLFIISLKQNSLICAFVRKLTELYSGFTSIFGLC